MMGDLAPSEIEAILHQHAVGRLGCHTKGKTYVVPVGYAYEDGMIYSYSAEGTKIAMMRDNPDVCFQVDVVATLTNWRSVICWGRFEELRGANAQRAEEILKRRFSELTFEDTKHITHGQRSVAASKESPIPKEAVLYRIRIEEKTGRYEQKEWPAPQS